MRRLTISIAVLMMAVGAHPGSAVSGKDGTRVEEVAAAASAGGMAVSGTAVFVDVPVVVGTDPEGDVQVPGIGTDLTRATIARPDPFGPNLRFTLSVADRPPALNGVPEAVCYHWPLQVTGGMRASVRGRRVGQAASPGSIEPSFQLVREDSLIAGLAAPLTPSPPAAFTPLSGRMEEGVVEFTVPMPMLQVQVGSRITAHAVGNWPISTVFPAGQTLCDVVVSQRRDTIGPSAYVVPGPTVELGIAPAGTPGSEIPLTVQAAVQPDGSFSGHLDASGLPGGQYAVRAVACYGEGNCGQATTTVTL